MSWFYYDQRWNAYDSATNTLLENQFQLNKAQATFYFRNVNYVVDFTTLEQTNTSTGFIREVDRYNSPTDVGSSLQASRLRTAKGIPAARTKGGKKQQQQQPQQQSQPQQQPPQPQQQHPLAVWEFFDKTYKPYTAVDSAAVEALYQSNNGTGQVTYSMNNWTYSIDFTNMTQTNTQTNVVRNLRRTGGVPLGAASTTTSTTSSTTTSTTSSSTTTGVGSLPVNPTQTKPASSYVSASSLSSLQQQVLSMSAQTIYTHYLNQSLPPLLTKFAPINFQQFQFPQQPELEIKLKQILCTVPQSINFQPISYTTLDLHEFYAPSQTSLLSTPSPDSSFKDGDNCPICLCELEHKATDPNAEDVIVLPCKHTFHISCLQEHFKKNSDCPSCRAKINSCPGSGPSGTISLRYSSQPIPGEPKNVGHIILDMQLNAGITDSRHQTPNVRYSGDYRQHFIPATPEGFKILIMTVKAFICYYIFSIGHSFARNTDNVIIWNIHCKTTISSPDHGYPDKNFYKNTTDELKNMAHITEDTL